MVCYVADYLTWFSQRKRTLTQTGMKKFFTTSILVFIGLVAFSQSITLNKAKSQLSILGTSSLHDWVSVVEKFDGSATVNGNELSNVKFEATVKSIKSGKSGMDKNIYSALDAENFHKIIFSATSLKIEGDKLTGKGLLKIKGKSNEIPVNLSIQKKGAYIISGQIDLKMTDYNVEPPTALLGTVKTGDKISLEMAFTLDVK